MSQEGFFSSFNPSELRELSRSGFSRKLQFSKTLAGSLAKKSKSQPCLTAMFVIA
ncbi:MAG: hypothetical protein MJE68_22775 [Proteobacteria bacterium]|nr:hypothetical protein [Pseudomonadota bacterium]